MEQCTVSRTHINGNDFHPLPYGKIYIPFSLHRHIAHIVPVRSATTRRNLRKGPLDAHDLYGMQAPVVRRR